MTEWIWRFCRALADLCQVIGVIGAAVGIGVVSVRGWRRLWEIGERE